ncbi:hypothetical protein AVEN_271979-1 [Araneus ventricosus]|uniref:Uncharacterized protein n=1 Tax=Araneus ventricosus TaxID=182803 RepID=A0A4Y2CBT5_ARAVE|nr:hypothetical protein AVEN_271979-1 [Araneus ventricosus]
MSLAKIMVIWVKNYIDEFEEDHSQELTAKELMELRCVSQQEVVEESLLEVDEVTAKQQTSGVIRDMLKAWEIITSYIEKHHPDKPMAMRATI